LREFAERGAGKIGLPNGVATRVLSNVIPGAGAVLPFAPTSETLEHGVEHVAGPIYEPQTTAGKFARTAGEFLPAAALPGGGEAKVVERLGKMVLAPALASEAAGQLTEGTPLEPVARIAGAALAPAAIGRLGSRSVRAAAAIPTSEAIGDAAEHGYKSVRDLGVQFKPEALSNLAGTVEQSLMRDGLRPSLARKTFDVLGDLRNPPAGATADFADVAALRRVLGKVAALPDQTESMAASRMIDHLDRFLDNPAASDVLHGDAQEAARLYKEANANYAAMKRSETLAGKVEAAEEQAASANSGANVENAMRQRVRDILKSPKLRRGYSPEEIVAMQSVVRGTAPQNVLRMIGNLLGGGGGLGAIAAGSAAALAGAGTGAVAVPLAGYGIKKLGNAIMRGRVNALDELIRSRAPAAAAANAARQAAAVARQQQLLRNARMGVLPAAIPAFGSLSPQLQRPPLLASPQASGWPQDQNTAEQQRRQAIIQAVMARQSLAHAGI
jgi:hypothetical protein